MTPPIRAPEQLAGLRVWLLLGLVALGLSLAFGARLQWVEPPAGLSPQGVIVAGVMVVMAALWILEGMPLAATALLPLVLFPLLGATGAKAVAKSYISSTVLLLMGGFFLAKGLQRWRVPHRLASVVDRLARGSPLALLFGLVGATAFLSMWLSNTATTLVMVAVAEAAIARASASPENEARGLGQFRVALLLGIAYSANVGGLATPIGTAPNLLLLSLREKLDPGAAPIPFVTWMSLALPVVLILLPLMGVLLAKVLPSPGGAMFPPRCPPQRGAGRERV